MLLGDLMTSNRFTPDPAFTGGVTADDMVLAIDISDTQDAGIAEYAVVQGYIEGVDAQLSATTVDKQYIRAGQSTTKTGTQRTFSVSGDRYIGDEFQDYVLSRERVYGVGQSVVTNYVWFCGLNGKGEKGTASIVVNSDASGNAGESAAVDIELRKVGAEPTAFTYSAA